VRSRARTAKEQTPESHPGYEVDIAGTWSTPREKAEIIRWVQTARDSLQPFSHGVYVNQLGDTSDELIRTAYGPNFARLVGINRKYDPGNVLRLNQNIKPDRVAKETPVRCPNCELWRSLDERIIAESLSEAQNR